MKSRLPLTTLVFLMLAYAGLAQDVIVKKEADLDGDNKNESITVTTRTGEMNHVYYDLKIGESGKNLFSLSFNKFKNLIIKDYNRDGLPDVEYHNTDSTGRVIYYDKESKTFFSIGFQYK